MFSFIGQYHLLFQNTEFQSLMWKYHVSKPHIELFGCDFLWWCIPSRKVGALAVVVLKYRCFVWLIRESVKSTDGGFVICLGLAFFLCSLSFNVYYCGY